MATSKTTTKKTTAKKNTANKAAPKDTGAMDEFLDTVVGETIQEEDIVTKECAGQPKAETSKEDFKKRWEDLGLTSEMQDKIEKDIEQINMEAAASIVDDNMEVKVNRITAVTDDDGNVLYYKVPSECEELQNLENKDEIKKQIAKIIADDIYKKFNVEMAEKQEPVEVKPVDITPEVVAPKYVFPLRVVDRWQ